MSTPYEYSRANPVPTTARDIHDTLQNADSVISSDCDNFEAIANLAIEALEARKVDPTDALAIWEYYCDYSDSGAMDKLPADGASDRRLYVVEHLTAFCNKWWTYAHTFLNYRDSYDWEFLPAFLGTLHTHDVKQLGWEQITEALAAVMDSDSFRQHEALEAKRDKIRDYIDDTTDYDRSSIKFHTRNEVTAKKDADKTHNGPHTTRYHIGGYDNLLIAATSHAIERSA